MILKLLKEIWTESVLELKHRYSIIRLLRSHEKNHLWVAKNCLIKRCRFGFNNRIYENTRMVDVVLGDQSYVSENCHLNGVTIGRYSAIGPNVKIGLGMHPAKTFASIHPLFYSKTNSACPFPLTDRNYFTEHQPVTIGHDVWIGANAVILDGVCVGDGAVVGAGAVVTRDIPPYGVALGIPAKTVKFRFTPDQIDFLQSFCWWDRDREWIAKHWKDFHDIKGFMEAHLKENKKGP